MRWPGNGKITNDGIMVLSLGYEENRIYSVGFLLGKAVSKSSIGWRPINDRIIMAGFQSRHAKVTIIHAYALIENAKKL